MPESFCSPPVHYNTMYILLHTHVIEFLFISFHVIDVLFWRVCFWAYIIYIQISEVQVPICENDDFFFIEYSSLTSLLNRKKMIRSELWLCDQFIKFANANLDDQIFFGIDRAILFRMEFYSTYILIKIYTFSIGVVRVNDRIRLMN